MNREEKLELVRELNSPGGKVHVFESDGTLYRMKILFRGEALFFSMDGQSLLFEDFSARKAVVRVGDMEHWLEGGRIADKSGVVMKIRELYYLYYRDMLQVII
ncbi:hypothetical protein [Parapedobacter tibetensis]|uniref:hypothetical protein n=1 Tax=Parapedobacter tibetensis TaxID=2972951 RepID=UPI00214DD487|nr:hypothetical protein [Parapedobacter tibetensis]